MTRDLDILEYYKQVQIKYLRSIEINARMLNTNSTLASPPLLVLRVLSPLFCLLHAVTAICIDISLVMASYAATRAGSHQQVSQRVMGSSEILYAVTF